MDKKTYVGALKKKQAREFVFSFFNEKSIIGLAGPDINEYLDWCKQKGINNVEIWEYSPGVMFRQLSNLDKERLKEINTSYKFGDILNAKKNQACIYDFDFCDTLPSFYEHLKKFKEERFVMTFSVRKVGFESTLDMFFKCRKERPIERIEKDEPIHHYVIKTVFGKYLAVNYFDTTPMVMIAKIS